MEQTVFAPAEIAQDVAEIVVHLRQSRRLDGDRGAVGGRGHAGVVRAVVA